MSYLFWAVVRQAASLIHSFKTLAAASGSSRTSSASSSRSPRPEDWNFRFSVLAGDSAWSGDAEES
jgi:hypothetical protein